MVLGLVMSVGDLVQVQQATDESLGFIMDHLIQDGNKNHTSSRGWLLPGGPGLLCPKTKLTEKATLL